MHVLISCKTTNLDVHGESIKRKIAHGLLSQDHLERLVRDHDKHHRCRKTLLELLDRHQISYVEVHRGRYWPDLSHVDAVISVGGDGTVLEASHHIHSQDIPVLGVRSSSMSVGYLCTCDINNLESYIDQLASGKTKINKLSRLQARIQYAETGREILSDPILNDFLFSNRNPAATTRYIFQVGEEKERQKSSGIWFATAAGSTAAIRTAGGTQVDRSSSEFQYVVREPYTPPGEDPFKFLKGFFSAKDESVRIENFCDHAILALDGQHGQLKLTFGDALTFLRAADLSLIV
ncbi:MAG: NAD(+)/NADH kinase [Oligoflexales bacterium]|nr:NAD(+)/NADH kinase [Oligoflexales bacterium]